MNKSNNNRRMPKTQQSKTQKPRGGSGPGPSLVIAQPRGDGPSVASFTSQSSRQGGSKPIVSSSRSLNGDLRIRIRHREYVAEVASVSGAALTLASFNINPGLALMFPWLSSIARNFESYVFRGLKFQYRTMCATSSTGKALLNVDWDASDSAPVSKQQFLQERTKADDAVWQNIDLVCDLQDLLKLPQRYIRVGTVSSTDIKLYDVGVLNVATASSNLTGTAGELWVEYDLELITPNVAPPPLSAKVVGATAITNAAIFGTAPVITGSAPVTVTNSTITFNQAGEFIVELDLTGTTLILPTSGTSTATVVALTNEINSAATQSLSSWTVQAKLPGQALILVATGSATVTAATARISQYQVSLA